MQQIPAGRKMKILIAPKCGVSFTKKGIFNVCSTLLIFLYAVFCVSSVTAITLTGNKLGTITYYPGLNISNHYTVTDTQYPIVVKVDGGELFPYLSVSEVVDNSFYLHMYFPKEVYVPPGIHEFALTVEEKPFTTPNEEGGIGSTVSVSRRFTVIVHSYQKDIETTIDAPNINQGDNATIRLLIQSVGYPDIENVQGTISFSDSEQKTLGKITFPTQPLAGLKKMVLSHQFNTQQLLPSTYFVDTWVSYDGKEKKANTTFLIGNKDILILNYTSLLQPGFNTFRVALKNNWGNPIRNVYAKLMVNGSEWVQTPSIDLPPWEEGELKTILKVENRTGRYEGILNLFFEGMSKEHPVTVEVTIPPAVRQELGKEGKFFLGKNEYLLGGMFLLIIAGIVVVVLMRKRNRKNKPNKEI